jgi:deoxyadenosine/deoxycytidine kinase
MEELKYIAVEGVIGAGKTSLAKKIAERLEANLVLEQFEINPFLKSFYQDRGRYAFQTQMFFLVNRYKQQQDLFQGNLFSDTIVADYIFEKDKIFAYLNLTKEEIKLYQSLFPVLSQSTRKPDLVIYLQSDVDRLLYNIKKRKREMELNISRTYLEELSEAYNMFFFKYDSTPLLIVDTTGIDFVNNKKDFDDLWAQIFRADRTKIEYYIPERKGLL